MRTKLTKKERNEKVRAMVREIAYRSMTGQNISRNELARKYKISAGIFTIAQKLGYIGKNDTGHYSVNNDFTDEIIDELYFTHSENSKISAVLSNDRLPLIKDVPVIDDLQEDDFKKQIKVVGINDLLAGIYERIGEDFIKLSNILRQ